jgi:glycosyltransferase
MKISIITPTYNSEETIAQCLLSIYSQGYSDIEQIIIDGKSTDKTIDLLHASDHRLAKIISEPDQGIYDAMNKGLRLATGDIIGILNSDDLYIDDHVIGDVVNLMVKTGADCLYADLFYVSSGNTDKVLRYWQSKEFVPGSFAKGWHPPHPTFFVRREIYEKYGLFDTNFKVSADFELMLRFLEKHRISTCYLPRPILKMRMGGHSSGTIRNILIGNAHIYKAFLKNGIPVSPLYFMYRFYPKVLQMLKIRTYKGSK